MCVLMPQLRTARRPVSKWAGRNLHDVRTDEEAPPVAPTKRPKLWFQIVLMGAFYAVYSYTRNLFGSALVDEGAAPRHAFDNAMHIIDAERFLRIFHEATIQSWFLGSDVF